MGWSEEVHGSRANICIQKAREERQLKRAKKPVNVASSNTSPAAFTVALSLAVGCMLWRKYDAQLREVQWAQLPIIKQFHALITGKPLSGPPRMVKPKPKKAASPATVSASGKAKVAKTSSSKPATQAAAEAAEARLKSQEGGVATTSQQQSNTKKKKAKK